MSLIIAKIKTFVSVIILHSGDVAMLATYSEYTPTKIRTLCPWVTREIILRETPHDKKQPQKLSTESKFYEISLEAIWTAIHAKLFHEQSTNVSPRTIHWQLPKTMVLILSRCCEERRNAGVHVAIKSLAGCSACNVVTALRTGSTARRGKLVYSIKYERW